MRTVSLDRLRERVENARNAYEGAKKAFHEALSGALNGGAQAKKVGWPKGKKRGPRKPKSVTLPEPGAKEYVARLRKMLPEVGRPEPLAPEPKPRKSRVKRNHPWKKKALKEAAPVATNPAVEAQE